MSTLNEQLNASLEEMAQHRRLRFVLAIAALVAIIAGLLAFTSLMYSSTPADIGESRIGAQSFD